MTYLNNIMWDKYYIKFCFSPFKNFYLSLFILLRVVSEGGRKFTCPHDEQQDHMWISVLSEALLMSTAVFLVLISRNQADIHNWGLWLVTFPESFFWHGWSSMMWPHLDSHWYSGPSLASLVCPPSSLWLRLSPLPSLLCDHHRSCEGMLESF